MTGEQTSHHKLKEVALKIVILLARRPRLRQSEIARALGEHNSTVMRALPITETLGIRLAEDGQGRLSIAD